METGHGPEKYIFAVLLAVAVTAASCARQPVRETVSYPNNRAHLDEVVADMKAGRVWRVICYGDSLTYGFTRDGSGQAEQPYPHVLQELLRRDFPQVEVVNEGHNGWTSGKALENFNRLVLSRNPHLVVLLFGTNDAVRLHGTAQYRKNMTAMAGVLGNRGIPVVLVTPLPLNNEFNENVLPYITELRNIHKENNLPFVNLHYEFMKRIKNREEFSQTFPDTVHPAPEYYRTMGRMIYLFIMQ